ncbi:hypothetical protein JQM84_03475 [Parabacteroides distasonis]|nr:hypothetical protein [Parabacteroides distasonis]
MANITNNYAPGSCIFEAGSTQNGDVYIQGGTFYQGVAKAQPEEEKQPSAEGEEASYAKTNHIFRASLFKTEEAYARLHQAILAFVKQAGVESAEEYQISPECQAEWYYVLKGIAEAGVAVRGGLKDVDFVRQMLAWYPDLFMRKEGEVEEKMVRRYALCISSQRQRWVGKDKQEVPINDMFAHSNLMRYHLADTTRFRGVALGVKKRIEALLQEE